MKHLGVNEVQWKGDLTEMGWKTWNIYWIYKPQDGD